MVCPPVGTPRDRPNASRLTGFARVEVAAQTVFRHLELTPAEGLHPQDHSPGWPDPDLTAIRRTGAHITAVHRDPDGTATIALTGLADVAAAAPLLAGAFTLVRGATCIVLDLRDNIGGDPATVTVRASPTACDKPDTEEEPGPNLKKRRTGVGTFS